MRVPVVGERVRVIGEEGEYLVISVDATRHVADLLRMTGTRRIEPGISLRALRPLEARPGARSEALDRLDSRELQSQE